MFVYLQPAAVAEQLLDNAAGIAARCAAALDMRFETVLGNVGKHAVSMRRPQDVPQQRSRLDQIPDIDADNIGEIIAVFRVADDDAIIGIEQHQSLRHGFQRIVELLADALGVFAGIG